MASKSLMTLDPASVRKFESLVNETAKTMDWAVVDVVSYSAKQFVYKAISGTPMMNKAEPRMILLGKVNPGLVAIWRRQGLIPVGAEKVNARKVGWEPYTPKGRGYAKSGWMQAARKLRVKTVLSGIDTRGIRKSGLFVDGRKRKERPYIILGNRVPFIEDLNQTGKRGGRQARFFQAAFDKMNREMERKLNRWAKKAASKWK